MSKLDQILQGVATDEVPGVVAAYATREGVQFVGAAGFRCQASADPMQSDTIFRIASMTKAITSVAALHFVESGRVGLDDEMSLYFPELGDRLVLEGFDDAGEPILRPAERPITLRRLLTHTAGFGYEFLNADLRRGVASGMIGGLFSGDDGFLNAPLIRQPGTVWEYGINIDWVGRLVELLSGESLGDYFRSHILEPLGMFDTTFELTPQQEARLVTVHHRSPDGSLREARDRPPARGGFHSGGGGLYSTAADYLRFLQAILLGGELEGHRILSDEMLAEAARDQIAPLRVGRFRSVDPDLFNHIDDFEGSQHGLCSVINPEALPTGRSAGSLGWAGVYNSYYWVDPDRGVTGVFLSQILPFFDSTAVGLSRAFETAVYEGLDSSS